MMVRKRFLAKLMSLAIAASVACPLPAVAQTTSSTSAKASGALDKATQFLNTLVELFPSLETFVTGMEELVSQAAEILPESIDLSGITGVLGLPDLDELNEVLAARPSNDTLDDIIFSQGVDADNTYSEATEFLRAQALSLSGQKVANSFIGKTGQEGSQTAITQAGENYASIGQHATAIEALADQSLAVDTTFERIDLLVQQQREEARQAQLSAENDTAIISGIKEGQILTAQSLAIDAERLRAENADRIVEARQAAAAAFIQRQSALFLVTPGGQPVDPDPATAKGLWKFIRLRQNP